MGSQVVERGFLGPNGNDTRTQITWRFGGRGFRLAAGGIGRLQDNGDYERFAPSNERQAGLFARMMQLNFTQKIIFGFDRLPVDFHNQIGLASIEEDAIDLRPRASRADILDLFLSFFFTMREQKCLKMF